MPRPLCLPVQSEHSDKAIAKIANRVRPGRFTGARRRTDRGNFDVAEIGGVAGAIARLGDMKRQRRQIARRAPRWRRGVRFGHILVPSTRESSPRYLSTWRHIITYRVAMQQQPPSTRPAPP